MLTPRLFGENLYDDWFNYPQHMFWPDMSEFRNLDRLMNMDNVEKKLYGKHAGHLMKTDVQEHEGHYEVAIDLPGFKKEDLSLELHEGYLTVSASKAHEQDQHEGDKPEGKIIRQERYAGSMTRSYYVGEGLTEEDIKARYEHGVLYLTLPKKETPKVPEKKTIMIEG